MQRWGINQLINKNSSTGPRGGPVLIDLACSLKLYNAISLWPIQHNYNAGEHNISVPWTLTQWGLVPLLLLAVVLQLQLSRAAIFPLGLQQFHPPQPPLPPPSTGGALPQVSSTHNSKVLVRHYLFVDYNYNSMQK